MLKKTYNLFLKKVTEKLEEEYGEVFPDIEKIALTLVEKAEDGDFEAERIIFDFLYTNDSKKKDPLDEQIIEMEKSMNNLHEEDIRGMARYFIDKALKTKKAEDAELVFRLSGVDRIIPTYEQDPKTLKLTLVWGYTLQKE